MSKMIIEEHMNGLLSAQNSNEGAIFTIIMNSTVQDDEKSVYAV